MAKDKPSKYGGAPKEDKPAAADNQSAQANGGSNPAAVSDGRQEAKSHESQNSPSRIGLLTILAIILLLGLVGLLLLVRFWGNGNVWNLNFWSTNQTTTDSSSTTSVAGSNIGTNSATTSGATSGTASTTTGNANPGANGANNGEQGGNTSSTTSSQPQGGQNNGNTSTQSQTSQSSQTGAITTSSSSTATSTPGSQNNGGQTQGSASDRPSSYKVRAKNGEGVSHLARKAINQYLHDHDQSLSRAQRLFVEVNLTNQSQPVFLEINEARTFQTSTIASLVQQASGLGGGELAAWQQAAVSSGYR